MKRLLLLSLCILTCASVYSEDSMTQILDMIAEDSPRLKAAAQAYMTERADNARIRALDAPEMEFNMLWGNDDIGNRNDVKVTQSVDMATISGKKGSLAASLDRQSSYHYQSEYIEVLYDARILLADIVYYNRLIETLDSYQSAMKALYDKTERSLKAGEATSIDMGKVRLQLSSARTATAVAVTERAALIERLRTVSGHPDIDFTGTVYECDELPVDFDSWLETAVAGSPMMRYLDSRVQSSEFQLDMDKMAWAPKLDVGYMAELARTDKYRGVTLGVSIPLWSNSLNVRRSRSAVSQAVAENDWQKQEFITQATNAWNSAHSMAEIAAESQRDLELSDTRALLDRALEAGELSVLDYLIESGMYYDAVKENLKVQQQYHHALSELYRFAPAEDIE